MGKQQTRDKQQSISIRTHNTIKRAYYRANGKQNKQTVALQHTERVLEQTNKQNKQPKKQEANKTSGQTRRLPSVKAKHFRSTKLAISIVRDSIAFSYNSSVSSLSVTFHSESSGPSAPSFSLPARATLPFRPAGPKRKHLAVFPINRDFLAPLPSTTGTFYQNSGSRRGAGQRSTRLA